MKDVEITFSLKTELVTYAEEIHLDTEFTKDSHDYCVIFCQSKFSKNKSNQRPSTESYTFAVMLLFQGQCRKKSHLGWSYHHDPNEQFQCRGYRRNAIETGCERGRDVTLGVVVIREKGGSCN